MLKLAWSLMKLTLIVAVVLIGSHLVKIRGRTISDQIKLGMAHTESMFFSTKERGAKGASELMASEREKLKELIRDLNR
jgi:hypothetical protein